MLTEHGTEMPLTVMYTMRVVEEESRSENQATPASEGSQEQEHLSYARDRKLD